MTATLTLLALAAAADPVRLHPDNPRYLQLRGKPLVLVTASEHYGSVINRPFDFVKYLDDAAAHGMTATRTFLLYRELQTARNPWSPCKPETPDFIAPWPRTGPGKALDGEPRYDLDRWNPEFFERLGRFLRAASDRDVVVELTLFSHTYNDAIWSLNPLKAANNLQGVGQVEWPDFDTLKEKELVARQEAFARKVVAETCAYDNVYYEVCNEPAGGRPGHGTVADVDAWLEHHAAVVRDELRKRGKTHLVFGTQAYDIPGKKQEFGASFAGRAWDAVVVHPHPGLRLGGRGYDLGDFMSKQLRLAQLRDFCAASAAYPKPVVLDEDNAASMYRDPSGWLVHRKRAWAAVLSGCHYDVIDFSVTVGREAGTAASRAGLRRPLGHLAKFVHALDVVRARPGTGWLKGVPAPLVAAGLEVPGKDYAAYLADGREADDPAAGTPVRASLTLALPPGKYVARLVSPEGGPDSPAWAVEGGRDVPLELPAVRHDIALRVTRAGD